MRHNPLLLALVLCLGAVSLSFKLLHDGAGVSPAHEREMQTLTQYMSVRGLVPLETFALNHEGSFQTHVYRHKRCDGGWLITPMYRNSEAVGLFARQSVYRHHKIGAVFYVLDERTHEEFPGFHLWVSQKIDVAKAVLGLSEGGISPVFAIRSFGHCENRFQPKENIHGF